MMLTKLLQNKIFSYGLCALVMLPLSGCLTLRSDSPPPAIFRLEAAPVTQPIRINAPAPTILMVNEPAMPSGFKGSDMVLHFDQGRRADRYAGALWSDDLSSLIREFIVAQGRSTFPELVLDTAQFGLAPDYTLNVDVLDFQPVYAGAPEGIPTLHTKIRFALMDSRSNALLADFILERHAPASVSSLSAITDGLESQMASILDEAFVTIAPQIK